MLWEQRGNWKAFPRHVPSVSARSEGWVGGVGVVRKGARGKEGHRRDAWTERPWHLQKHEALEAKWWEWEGECSCSVDLSLYAECDLAGSSESRLSGICSVSILLFLFLHPILGSLASSSVLPSLCPAYSYPLRILFTCLTCLLLPC